MTDENSVAIDVGAGRRSRLRHPLVIGAVGLVLISVGAALAFQKEQDPATTTIVAGNDRPITNEPHSLDAHNSPTIAYSPEDPSRLIVAGKIDRPNFSAALHISDDGGESWSAVEFPTPPKEDRPYAPDIAWGPDGTVYLTFVTLTGRGNNPEAAWLTTSHDGGKTWAAPQRVLGPWTFQVRLAVNPKSGELYLTWLQADRESVGTLSFVKTGLPILASRSDDGGETWSEATRVSATARQRVGAPVPVVGPEGNLYILYYDFKDDRFDWENLEGGIYQDSFELVLARSERGRLEFTEHVVAPQVAPFERFLVYLPKPAGLAVDTASGDLYAAWPDGSGGDADVLISRSEDLGATWSKPVAVHHESEGDQYMPTVAVAPNGRIDVAYLDRRDQGEGEVVAAYFGASFDGARTWANVVLSSEVFSASVGPEGPETSTLGRADQATQAALASHEEQSFAAWTDARGGTPVTGRLDIYFAPIRFSTQ